MFGIHTDLPPWRPVQVWLAICNLVILPEMVGKLLLDLQLMQLVIPLLLLEYKLHSLPLLFL